MSAWLNYKGGRYRVKANSQWIATKGSDQQRGWAATPFHAELAAKRWLDGKES